MHIFTTTKPLFMYKIKLLLFMLLLGVTSINLFAGNNKPETMTAEDIFQMAESRDVNNQEAIKAAFDQLSAKEKVALLKLATERAQSDKALGAADDSVALYVLAVLLPPVAVGIFTDWGMPTAWNLLWTILGWLPGVVHAFYIIL
jgi:uncharacterized membrane protein YqaE (UPF0057 family)